METITGTAVTGTAATGAPLTGALRQASEQLATAAQVSLVGVDDELLCEVTGLVERVGRLVDGLRVQAAAELSERSRFELGSEGLAFRLGHRRGSHLIEALTRVSPAEAARRVRLGALVRPRVMLGAAVHPGEYPQVAAALASGDIGIDAASVIVSCLEQARRGAALAEDVAVAEEQLVAAADHEPADAVAVRARVWREALDPDGAEPREERLRERRCFRLGREREGLTPFSGACEPVFAALLRAALAEADKPGSTPRFLADDDRDVTGDPDSTGDPSGTGVPDSTGDPHRWVPGQGMRDPRSREQRHYDVFTGLLTAGLRATGTEPGGMRSTATINAVITLGDLRAGTGIGWLDDVAEPVSAATIQALACGAGYRPILLGDHGEPLWLGQLRRFFSTAQVRAMAVRDGGCVWPGCTAPPSWCDAHHIREFSRAGPTDVDNGVLLCPAHHHMLHHSAFTMKMINGKPHLLAPVWIDPDQQWQPLGRSRIEMTAGIHRGAG